MIPFERVTTGLLGLLETVSTFPVGDHGTYRPDRTPIDTSDRYGILWHVDGGLSAGSVGDPHQTFVLVYQVDSVGRSRQQCEQTGDTFREAMVAIAPTGGPLHILEGDGWRGGLRTLQTLGAPTPEGTDNETRDVWTMRERFDVEVVLITAP